MKSNPKKSVLIVEDEISLNQLYVQLLQGDGYEVTSLKDGPSALETLTNESFDIVLLDIMLPEMDGLSVLEKLHAMKKKPKQGSVILLTNLAQNETISKALQYDVKGYLIKSRFTPDQFLEEVKKLSK